MEDTTERWLPVVGYEGLYEISDQGRVKSLARQKDLRMGRWAPVYERILSVKPRPAPLYPQACLSRDGQAKTVTIYRLVTEAFLGPRPDGLEVLHRNGDGNDNRLGNLHYGTHSENQRDAVAHGHNHFASQTHCIRGHPFDEENTYLRPKGGRTCRVCQARSSRLSQARRRTLEIGAQQ